MFWHVRENALPPATPVSFPARPAFNALDFYHAATQYVPAGIDLDPDPKDTAKLTLVEEAADRCPGVTSSVEQGLCFPYYNRPVIPASWYVPFAAKFVDVARVLALQGRACARRGDRAGLVGRCLDGIEMGQTITRGATLWNLPIQAACEETCRRPLWDDLDKLSMDECRTVLARYRKIEDEHQPLALLVRQDKLFGQMQFTLAFHDRNWRDSLLSTWPNDDDDKSDGLPADGASQIARWAAALAGKSPNAPTTLEGMGLILLSPKQVYRDYVSRLDAEIVAAGRPYGAWPSPVRSDVIAEQLTFDGAPLAPVIDAENVAENRLLETAVALRIYKLTHGSYPANLPQLTPHLLATPPLDPFTDGRTLRYRCTGGSYSLYSVGPDKADDGGTPMPTSDLQNGLNRPSRRIARADIVAGLTPG